MFPLVRIPLKTLGLIMFLLALMLNQATAQSNTDGAVGGSVSDPQGAVVPNAKVTVHNLGTNRQAEVTTDSDGRFRAIQLQPGTYEVSVEAQGFAAYKQQNVVVEVGRVSNVDAKLSISGGQEHVEVTAEAAAVNTEQQDFSTNINQTSINELPTNGRRWSNFAVLTPGVVPDGNFGLLSFRGISGLLNNNTIDGGDNTQAFFSEERGRTRLSYVISQDSIREFQVNTSNYSAEYGHAAGGVVNAVTKSGTNDIHGSAYYFNRDNKLGAVNPFTIAAVQDANGNYNSKNIKPKDKRHQFGATVGGPIIRDKVFFFFSYDQQKRNFPGVAIPNSPGTFFAPMTTSTGGERDTLVARLGSLTAAQTAFDNGLSFIKNLTGNVPRRGDQLIFLPKIDWAISKGETFSVVYNRTRWTSPSGIQTQATNNRAIDSFGNDYVHADSTTGKLVSLLTDRISNEARFTYARDNEFEFTQPSVPGELHSGPGGSAVDVFISDGSGSFEFGKPTFLDRRALPDETRYQYADAATFAYGKHLIKAGVDISHINDVEDNLTNEGGSYSYNKRVDFFTDLAAFQSNITSPKPCGANPTPTVGHCYSSFSQGFGPTAFEFQTNDYSFFVQDDWRVLPRFTLNLGARYEHEQLPSPQLPNPNLPKSATFPSQKGDFGPRFGFAWDVFGGGKTSLRGGYGIYYGRILNSTIANAITNTGLTTGQIQVSFGGATLGAPVFPNTLASGSTSAKPNVVEFASNFRAPLVHEADLAFQQQVGANMVFSASYLLSLGRHLPNFIDVNLFPSTQSFSYLVSGGPFDGQRFSTPVFTSQLTPSSPVPLQRPNALFNSITDITSNVNSEYNAAVFELNRRVANGLQFQTNYTWSHAIDQGQGSATFTNTNVPQNPFNQAFEKSSSNFDTRHRFVTSLVWTPELKTENRVAKWLVNGFEFAPVFVASTGRPVTGSVSGNLFIGGSLCPAGTPSGTSCAGANSAGINGSAGSSRPFFIGRNAYSGPGLQNMDLRIARSFKPAERMKVQLIAEAFNLFNHQNFSGVATPQFAIDTISATNLTGGCNTVTPRSLPTGTIFLCNNPTFLAPNAAQSTLYREREIQLGARITF